MSDSTLPIARLDVARNGTADLQAMRREVCILARGGVNTVSTAVVVTPHKKIRFPPYLQRIGADQYWLHADGTSAQVLQ